MNIHGWIFRTFRTRRGCMDWVSVQCSCQSFTFGVPFVGLGKFYTVDSPKEIGPLASSPRKQKCFFPCQGKKIFFFLGKEKRNHILDIFKCSALHKSLWSQGWKKWLEFPNLWGHAIRWTCTQEKIISGGSRRKMFRSYFSYGKKVIAGGSRRIFFGLFFIWEKRSLLTASGKFF